MSVHLGIHIWQHLKALLHLIENLIAIVMLTELKLLLSLSNSANELSILISLQSRLCILEELNGLIEVYTQFKTLKFLPWNCLAQLTVSRAYLRGFNLAFVSLMRALYSSIKSLPSSNCLLLVYSRSTSESWCQSLKLDQYYAKNILFLVVKANSIDLFTQATILSLVEVKLLQSCLRYHFLVKRLFILLELL